MVQFLEDKTILVTGATGFLAKSKMLRVQPNVKKIYLLSRAPGAKHDVALGINTVRAENVICFAKKSVKLKVLVRIYIPTG
uniref:Fatty acyl-CoA reductase n=1 Tax=Populus trichocarpa TaxID=3694 RepID=A0A2K1YQX8_POPTR